MKRITNFNAGRRHFLRTAAYELYDAVSNGTTVLCASLAPYRNTHTSAL